MASHQKSAIGNQKSLRRSHSDPVTFTDRLRIGFAWLLDPIVDVLYRAGIHPNWLTVLGVLGIAWGAYFAAIGNFFWAGFLFLLMTPFDALDGPLARRRGEPQNFGAFVDSVSDRYAELLIYGGLLWYAQTSGDRLFSIAIYLAAFGSVLVSYIRARAQAVGLDAKVGLFSRVERYFILGPLLMVNQPLVGVSIIAIGANFTALQRIFYVRQASLQSRTRK